MKVGIAGVGYWGSKVVREYVSLFNEGLLDSVALYDTDTSKVSQFNGVRAYSKFDDFLDNVDCIHVCTPNDTHYSITKEALEKGVHVLVEKPMTTKASQAYELVELAFSEGLILQVGHIFRFSNAVRKIRELCCNNYFGDIFYFNLAWTHYMRYIRGVDILWDLLPHPLDILNFITSQWPSKIVGVGKSYRRKKLYEAATLELCFENEVFATVHLSWLSPVRRRLLEIVGSKRSAIVDCVGQTIQVFENNGDYEYLKVNVNNTIRDEILNFMNAIKTGKNSFNSCIIGAKSVEYIESAIKVLEGG